MANPLISCIVPVFNGEPYLREALGSILAQTYRPLEVIVADDGSTDGTTSVVAEYGDHVRYLWQPNAGQAAARNLGLHGVRGELVAFLDADDLWHPDKLRRQMDRFEARPELEMCVTYMQNFWIPELQVEQAKFRNRRLSEPMPGYMTQTLLARRSLFDRIGHFNPSLQYGNDTDWFLRAGEQKTVVEVIGEVLVYRRLHWSNISRSNPRQKRDEYLRVIKASLDRSRGPMGVLPRFEFSESDPKSRA